MKAIGVTGPISSGKSTLSQRISQKFKYPFVSMDNIVSDLLRDNKDVFEQILNVFPEIKNPKTNNIDKDKLREIVFEDPLKLQKLESILHPLVERKRIEKIKWARRNKFKGIIFEIPLLFEVKAEGEQDIIILIDTPKFVQKERFLKRPHMQVKYLHSIEKRLLPMSLKKKKASVVIKNGLTIGNSFSKIVRYIQKVENNEDTLTNRTTQKRSLKPKKQDKKQIIPQTPVGKLDKEFELNPTRYGDWEKNGRAIDF